MSGIVGSRLNIRGSGLVGSLGTDGQVFTSAGAGKSAVFEAAAGGDLTPSFYAHPNGNDAISDSTTTVVQNDTERYDNGGCYNNTGSTVSLNGISTPAYSFAPNVAGKYYVFSRIVIAGANDSIMNTYQWIHLNGATTNAVATYYRTHAASPDYNPPSYVYGIIDFDGTDDYVTQMINCDNDNAQALEWWGATTSFSCFGAFRIQGA